MKHLMTCPMCEHGQLVYQQRANYLPSHVYICNECPFIGFEYVHSGDAIKAAQAIERDNTPAYSSHRLIIKSLHDAIADCSCGGWSYRFTGEATRAEIEKEHASHCAFYAGTYPYSPCTRSDCAITTNHSDSAHN